MVGTWRPSKSSNSTTPSQSLLPSETDYLPHPCTSLLSQYPEKQNRDSDQPHKFVVTWGFFLGGALCPTIPKSSWNRWKVTKAQQTRMFSCPSYASESSHHGHDWLLQHRLTILIVGDTSKSLLCSQWEINWHFWCLLDYPVWHFGWVSAALCSWWPKLLLWKMAGICQTAFGEFLLYVYRISSFETEM